MEMPKPAPSRQPLRLGEFHDVGGLVRERLPRIVRVLHLFHEIVDGERARKARGASRRQRVVRSRHVVAERLRAVVAEEDGARVFNERQLTERVAHRELEMLGRKLV